MVKHDNNLRPEDGERLPDEKDPVGRLIRLAGRRPPVSPERAARVKAAVRDRWRGEVRRIARRRRVATWAGLAAATLAAAVGVGLWTQWHRTGGAAGPVFAERVEGTVWCRPAGTDGAGASPMLHPGDRIGVGAELATADAGRAAIRLPSGHSLRLDTGTTARLVSPGIVALDRGTLYVDSGGARRAGSRTVIVRTAHGTVREVGTQFEVHLAGADLRVRVREGTVTFRGTGGTGQVTAGEELSVRADGTMERRRVPPFGPEWAWVGRISPEMEIQGRRLGEFLDWAAQERGWRVRLEGTAAARAAREVRLNGSIRGLDIEEALDAVLPTCRMSYRIEGGSLIVFPASETAG